MSQQYSINTQYGVLVAEWIDQHNLVVKTPDSEPLLVNRVAYGVRAYMHKSGCLQADEGAFSRDYNRCWSHRDGQNTGQWVYGSICFGRGLYKRDGEIVAYTTSPQIGKGGQSHNGGASASARSKITQALEAGVATLARTAADAPRQAEIEKLERERDQHDAHARRLREEAHQEDEAAESIRQQLFEMRQSERVAA